MENSEEQIVKHSVMDYITLSLATLVGIILVSIFISYWLTELADKDAQSINMSGSMRMQTYHIGLLLERNEPEKALEAIKKLHNTWNHNLFTLQHGLLAEPRDQHSTLTQSFGKAYNHWRDVTMPTVTGIAKGTQRRDNLIPILETQIFLTDQLVTEFQRDAERKIINLRLFQIVVLFLTVGSGSLIFYLLKNRIEKPLSLLKESAEEIIKGNLDRKVDVEGNDELTLMATTFNRMSDSISESYAVLEERVDARTEALKQNNIALDFLFKTAKKILESRKQGLDLQALLEDLSNVIGKKEIEMCLFTQQGDHPYLQLVSETDNTEADHCQKNNCTVCRGALNNSETLIFPHKKRFPIIMGSRQYGLIDLKLQRNELLPQWQHSLVESVANQFAIALSIAEQKEKESLFAMVNERTVIARELHDSLAQALSYLQIQVTRLQKAQEKEKYELQPPIIEELREGLSSAYRQLRELLTTFRLKIDEGGLRTALENTVDQLRERSDMDIHLDYHLNAVPLAANEEIHLLQIVREAGQNAIHHSKGEHLKISLKQDQDNRVVLQVKDDGVGIPYSPEKLNHYGLAIMNERSRSLRGDLKIQNVEHGGTEVTFSFIPNVQQQA